MFRTGRYPHFAGARTDWARRLSRGYFNAARHVASTVVVGWGALFLSRRNRARPNRPSRRQICPALRQRPPGASLRLNFRRARPQITSASTAPKICVRGSIPWQGRRDRSIDRRGNSKKPRRNARALQREDFSAARLVSTVAASPPHRRHYSVRPRHRVPQTAAACRTLLKSEVLPATLGAVACAT